MTKAEQAAGSDATVVAFDLSQEVVHGIQNGDIEFCIDQQPYLQGYEAVDTLWLYLTTATTSVAGSLCSPVPGSHHACSCCALLPRHGRHDQRPPGHHEAVQDVRRDPEEDPASVLPFDWPWDERETIWPCRDCPTWRAELFLVEPDGAIWVREWHAVACPIWAEIEGLEA